MVRYKDAKNLLAFSGGVDSAALFFRLLDAGVRFDIAIVDYGVREQSKKEVAHAQNLAKKYDKKCFVLRVKEKISSNFEAKAREIRYAFFESLITTHGYENLFLAHQLNDRLEWFLMEFSKGAGLGNLLGFKQEQNIDKNGLNYNLIRPLINTPKSELVAFCKSRKILYFNDDSNANEKFLRNFFRHNFSDALVEKFGLGIAKSFRFLERDLKELEAKTSIIKHEFGFEILGDLESKNALLGAIDKSAKKLGYVLSQKQRDEILKTNFCCEVGGKISIEKGRFAGSFSEPSNDSFSDPFGEFSSPKIAQIFVFTSPQKNPQKNKKLEKIIKNAKIPPKLRMKISEIADEFGDFKEKEQKIKKMLEKITDSKNLLTPPRTKESS